MQTIWSQFICTFIFVSVILVLKGSKSRAPTDDLVLVALAVALTLWALITLNYHTGACFNPAVACGQTFFQIMHLDGGDWLSHYYYAYTLGPILGGIAAGASYILLAGYIPKEEEQNEHVSEMLRREDPIKPSISSDNPICFNDGGEGM